MQKVVIVAKTRRGSGACVGGVTFEGRSVRLEAFDRAWNEHAGLEYEVGDVWAVAYAEPETLIPPHVENIIVHEKRRLGPITDLRAFVLRHMPPKEGGVDVLYDGLTEATAAGVLYIAERVGVPPYSTMFWIPDRPLHRVEDAKRIRYRYPTPDGGRTLTFVGFQEPVDLIPAGALLRVSLAHWWRPDDRPDWELRCHVQLSGWIGDLPPARTVHAVASQFEPRTQAAGTISPGPAVTDATTTGSPIKATVTDAPERVLRRVFGYEALRPMQARVIENLLAGRDSLAIMPTGSGKSMCYQLPALLWDGLTVVVSPLISLMEDQVSQLRELGAPAVFLNSTLDYQTYRRTMDRVRAGAVKLLYVAPETLLRPETLVLLEDSRVVCLAIDEAHCISAWGHDFRPEYRQLRAVRDRLPQAVCIALTATATPRVREDIQRSLGIGQADTFVASFDRENLFLAAQPRVNGLQQVLQFLDEHREESGIIYCATRKQVDVLTAQLRARGWSALPYHAGLDDATRREHQRRFSRDDVPIMVATVAFGMGIDKSNVRFVVHYDLPQDLESYYQQIGRAGRDGLRADCLLLYSFSDVHTINRFIEQSAPDQQQGATMRLQAMLRYAEATVCRRRLLLDYFGERYGAENCGMCDVCLGEVGELVDVTVLAQKFLSCVKRTGERFGVNHVIDVLRGSRAKRILRWGHDKLSTYGIGQELSSQQWKYLAGQFIQQGLVNQDMTHGHLTLTKQGWAVLRGKPVHAQMLEEKRTSTAHAVVTQEYDRELFALLRAKRKALADAADLPPYVVFSDRSLMEMAAYFPQSRQSFARIHGVGQAKLEKYADEFLPIIQTYCQAQNIPEKEKTTADAVPPPRLGDRTTTVVTLFNDGKSLDELMALFGVKRATIINHLWKAVQAGQALREDGLLAASSVPGDVQEQVLAAFTEHGPERLRPVYDALEGTVDWDDLRLLRLVWVLRRA